MIFNLKIKNEGNRCESTGIEYIIIKRFIIILKKKIAIISKGSVNVEVKKHESLYIQRYKDSNEVDISLTIKLKKSINKIKICKCKKRWKLTPKESSGNYGNEGNGNGPVVNVEIGGV